MKTKHSIEFDSKRLANDLRVWQMKNGCTLQEVSKLTGIHVSTLSRIRNKKDNALFIEVGVLSVHMGFDYVRYIVRREG